MTEPFNPFASLLGLNPKLKNPHHFQLLGVSTRVTDQVEIQNAVDASVKELFTRLAKVPPGEHEELVEKLKQRISIARKTLLNPKLRASYVEHLKQRARASKSRRSLVQPPSQPEKTPPKPTAQPAPLASAPAAVPPANPAAAPIDPKSLIPPTPAASAPASAIEPAPPKSKPPIPMAVPISEVPSVSPPAASLVAAPNAPETQGVAVNADGVPIDQVRINKTPLRRKRSKAGPILAVGMLVSAGIGGYLVYQNWDVLAKLAGIDGEIPSAPGIVEDEDPTIYDPTTANSNAAAPDPEKKLPEVDLNNVPEEDVDKTMLHPDTSDSTQRTPEREKALAARLKERLAMMERAEESENVEEDGGANPDNDPDPEVEPGETQESDANRVTLDQSQLARFRRHIERAQRSIYRRQKSTASRALQTAEEVLEEVRETENDTFGPKQGPIVQMATDTTEILELVNGFWEQVVASCQEIPGGQEIQIGAQIVALIEADEEKFIVRNAGSNITYQYHYCPPGLAMALATQGAIPDIPTWSKQQAAFYAIDELGGANHQSRIEACLRIAEDANHDCSGIRRYIDFEFGSVGIPSEKIELAPRKELDKAVADFRAENEYTDPKKLEPDVAGMLAEMLLHIDSPNFKQHVAVLEEARVLAIRGGEVSKAEDAIIDLDHYAEIDRANLLCDSFIDISKRKLTRGQQRALMEHAIPFLKSESGELAKRRSVVLLAKQLTKIAQSEGMTDAIRRLSQLN